MNKTLALIALLGLVSAPAFANEAAPAVKAEKVVAKDAKEEAKDAKADAKAEAEAKKDEKK